MLWVGLSLKLRHRVVATACVYFRRFYLENSFCEFEPALVGATCLQLASKVEERLLLSPSSPFDSLPQHALQERRAPPLGVE